LTPAPARRTAAVRRRSGAEILVPRPSYPLLDHLARLDAVGVRCYDLEYHRGWAIDFASLERALSPAARAIVVVTPNNPTGSRIKQPELERLAALARGGGDHRRRGVRRLRLAKDAEREPGTARWRTSVTFSLAPSNDRLPRCWRGSRQAARCLVDERWRGSSCRRRLPVGVDASRKRQRSSWTRAYRSEQTVACGANYHHLVQSVPDESGCTVPRQREAGTCARAGDVPRRMVPRCRGRRRPDTPWILFDFQTASTSSSALPAEESFRDVSARPALRLQPDCAWLARGPPAHRSLVRSFPHRPRH
jgi:hypothetical protein